MILTVITYYNQQNCKIVKNRSADNKKMPYGMKVFYFLYGVKYNSRRVKNAAHQEKNQRNFIHMLNHRFYCKYYNPAHCYVADKGGLAELFKVHRIKHYADNRRTPDHSEKRPAHRPSQRDESYGGVCSRNKEENGVVVHYSEKRFGFAIGDGVIKG